MSLPLHYRYDYLAAAPSTMDVVATAMQDGAPPGLVVQAATQTQGRGRDDGATGKPRSWTSIPGNLMFGVAVARSANEHPRVIDFAAAQAVIKAAQHFLPQLALVHKYPNDVMVSAADGVNHKIAGILQEFIPGRADVVNLGIGVNLIGAPERSLLRADADYQAGSLSAYGLPPTVTPQLFLQEVLAQFDAHLARYRAASMPDVMRSIQFLPPDHVTIMLQPRLGGAETPVNFVGFAVRTEQDGLGRYPLVVEQDGVLRDLPYRDYALRAATATDLAVRPTAQTEPPHFAPRQR
jgi:biotin-(acetyl-CoA carboxylase) ligase